MAHAVWAATWPVERIRQRAFFTFGMDVLLSLDLFQMCEFFRWEAGRLASLHILVQWLCHAVRSSACTSCGMWRANALRMRT